MTDNRIRARFVWWYCDTFGCRSDVEVTRIEWTWDGAVLHDGMTEGQAS